MENRINIENELRAISPVVAEIGAGIPYEVPQGYFEELAGQILQKIREAETSPVLQEAKTTKTYQVPEGYFEGLADAILQRVKASRAASAKDELKALSPLLSKLDKKNPFAIPEGYFEELTDNAIAGAKAIDFVNEELENLPPVLEDLKHKATYEVPAGYFDTLADDLLNKAKGAMPAKVVSLSFTRRIIRYAAAAVVAGLLITTGIKMFNKQPSKPVATTPAIAKVDESVPADIQQKLDQASDQELMNYLDNDNASVAGTGVVNTTDVSDQIDESDMKAMLADISDKELETYLEKYVDYKGSATN